VNPEPRRARARPPAFAREEQERDDALIDRFTRDDWAAFQRDIEQDWRP